MVTCNEPSNGDILIRWCVLGFPTKIVAAIEMECSVLDINRCYCSHRKGLGGYVNKGLDVMQASCSKKMMVESSHGRHSSTSAPSPCCTTVCHLRCHAIGGRNFLPTPNICPNDYHFQPSNIFAVDMIMTN